MQDFSWCIHENEHLERLVYVKPLLNLTVYNLSILCDSVLASLQDQLVKSYKIFNKKAPSEEIQN